MTVQFKYGMRRLVRLSASRFEVTNSYRDALSEAGMVFSGTSPDGHLVEIGELKDHPFFIGSQFHPELKSRPLRPHPLFKGFVGACARNLAQAREKEQAAR